MWCDPRAGRVILQVCRKVPVSCHWQPKQVAKDPAVLPVGGTGLLLWVLQPRAWFVLRVCGGFFFLLCFALLCFAGGGRSSKAGSTWAIGLRLPRLVSTLFLWQSVCLSVCPLPPFCFVFFLFFWWGCPHMRVIWC